MIWLRGPCSKAGEWDSRTVVKPCMWFQEEPSQFSMGQTAKSLTCSIMEKPLTGLDECLRILLLCFRAGNTDMALLTCGLGATWSCPRPATSRNRSSCRRTPTWNQKHWLFKRLRVFAKNTIISGTELRLRTLLRENKSCTIITSYEFHRVIEGATV